MASITEWQTLYLSHSHN